LGLVYDICKGLQYLLEAIAELKQMITSELVLHEIKDIIEDIHKLLQAIQEIIRHIPLRQSTAIFRNRLGERAKHWWWWWWWGGDRFNRAPGQASNK